MYVFAQHKVYRKFSLRTVFHSLSHLALFHCQVRISSPNAPIICNRYLNFRNSSFHSIDCFLDPFRIYIHMNSNARAMRTLVFFSLFLFIIKSGTRVEKQRWKWERKKKKELFRHRFNWKCNGKFIGSAFWWNRIPIFKQPKSVCVYVLFPIVSSGSLSGRCCCCIHSIPRILTTIQSAEMGSEKK